MSSLLTKLLAVIFLVIGVLGFILPSPLLGLFEVDPVHNVIHILTGVVAAFAAMKGRAASRIFLILFGIIYAIVALLGFVMNGNILGIIHVNMPDNWLHFGIALACLLVGLRKHT